MSRYNIAVIGATGNTGQALLAILKERQFPVRSLAVFASPKSRGKVVHFCSSALRVSLLEEADFSTFDIAFFCAGADVSRLYAPQAAQARCIVIDKSSAFRAHPSVPLVVPEINGSIITSGAPLSIVSNPNCVAIPLSMALAPLRDLGLKRVVVSTYQSVSGAGRRLCEELHYQAKNVLQGKTSEVSIGFNVIPLIGNIETEEEPGFSGEETKIMAETQKILQYSCPMCITSVRVPVFVGHGMSVAAECTYLCSHEELLQRFRSIPGLYVDDNTFHTPQDVAGTDDVFIGRIRRDSSVAAGIVFWVVADNLRKGAATNGVQIAEALVARDPSLSAFRCCKV
ncbi:MAG: aspartate-semialdehyde dehydrogenase [Holosporales bacterium]|jgi:aspartate-semialdehyde dehydrogenase|nr:aspartate-semialdehyde dehydrogenase [Holosporales bacterium]